MPHALRIGSLIAVALAASMSLVRAQCPQWTPGFAAPTADGIVDAAVEFDDGSGCALYIAGSFTTIGGVAVNHVARLDAHGWSAVGGGTNGGVNALVVHDDGSGPALYAGGLFTSAGGVPASNVARWDGTNWIGLGAGIDSTVVTLASFDDGTGPALYAGGSFLHAGGVQARYLARWNGTSWSQVGSQPDDWVSVLSVLDDGTGPKLYVGGFFLVIGTTLVNHVALWNGTSWVGLGAGFAQDDREIEVSALTIFDDGGGKKLYAGGFLINSGTTNVHNIARWNGTSWSRLGTGTDQQVYSLAAFDDGSGPALYAGGLFTLAGGVSASKIARWNGTSWSQLAGGANQFVKVLTVHDDGSGPALYAAGFFTHIGAVTTSVARWNGTGWTATPTGAGQGVSNAVRVLAEYDDGQGPALYAGGDFFSAGSAAAVGIARWDGASWSPLGSGLIGFGYPSCLTLAVFDPGSGARLYAGGSFTSAGGVNAHSIASWNGATWSAVPGVGLNVYALLAFDDGSGPALYVGGDFSISGVPGAAGIARWNGSNWSALPGGTNGTVYALCVFDDGSGPALYAAGTAFAVGGVSGYRVAKWNGTSWSPLGRGINGSTASVYALCAFDDGSGPALYAGGEFLTAGAANARSIARWNGGAWSALGSGLSGGDYPTVSALTVHDDGNGPALYAAGKFTSVSGVPANAIARWNGTSWSALDSGLQYGVNAGLGFALLSYDDHSGGGPDLYVGGGFDHAGSRASSNIARRLGCRAPGVSFCSGDGSGTPCPCGNSGVSRNGCANSINPAGAHLSATGAPSLSADTLALDASGMPDTLSFFLQGTARENAGLGTPLFDGLLCVDGGITRLGITANAGGTAHFPPPGGGTLSTRAALPRAGGTRYYQVIYRNQAPSFCPPATANATDGLALVWYP